MERCFFEILQQKLKKNYTAFLTNSDDLWAEFCICKP